MRPWQTVSLLQRQADSLAAAVRELVQKDRHRGGDGTLRDLVVSFAEEDQTVLVFTDWADDARTLVAAFELALPLTEESFHLEFASFYVETVGAAAAVG